MTQPPDHLPGLHLLVDLWGGPHLADPAALEAALLGAAHSAGATVIASQFRAFPGHAGVTGMVLLAESHISIHSWPELGFAAVDIFMCGTANPHTACHHLVQALGAERVKITEIRRGMDQRNQVSQPAL